MTLYLNHCLLLIIVAVLLSFPHWAVLPNITWMLFFVLLVVSILGIVQLKYRRRTSKLMLIVAFGMALLFASIFGHLYKERTSVLFKSGPDITIKGEVSSLFKKISHGFESSFVVSHLNGELLPFYQRPEIRITTSFETELGSIWQFSGVPKRISGLKNEAGFDLEQFYAANGWSGRFKVKNLSAIQFPSLPSWRYTLIQNVHYQTRELDHQPLIMALAFAVRNDISTQVWENWQSSGIIHLIAISGLHIGIAFGLGHAIGRIFRYTVSQWCWLPHCAGILFAAIYAWLAGFNLPTVRALVMCCVVSIWLILGRKLSVFELLVVSMTIVLLIHPMSSLLSSFWLSFGAVTAIYLTHIWCSGKRVLSTDTVDIATAKKISNFQLQHWLPSFMLWFRMHLIVSLLFALLSTIYFSGFSWVSPLYNMLVIPWFCFVVVPLLFIAMLFGTFSLPFSETLYSWLDMTLGLVNSLTELEHRGWVVVSLESVWVMVVAIFYLVLQSALRRQSRKWWLIAALVGYYTVNSMNHNVFERDELVIGSTNSLVRLSDSVVGATEQSMKQNAQSWLVDVLDIGHGTAILLETNNKSVLIDTGPAWESGSSVNSVVVPILHQRGVVRLEGVVISHFDNDHAGGLDDVIDKLNPSWIMSSSRHDGWADERSLFSNKVACITGSKWLWEGLILEALWPPKLVSRPYNPQSCVVRVSDKGQKASLLLSGDIESVGEYLLTRGEHHGLKSDVLIVPHHGSKTSSTLSFISSVEPELAIVTSAKGGRWNLPHPSVVERYQQLGIDWLNTAEDGQVSIVFRGDKRWVSTQRSAEYTPWYRQMLRNGVE